MQPDAKIYTGADVVCPHCSRAVPGARLTHRTIAEREADVVALGTGVPKAILLAGDAGGRTFARARWALWLRLKELHRWPMARIARVCGGLDPSTVLYALRILERERSSDAA